MKEPSVGVVGSGSFATAIVKMLSENMHTIHWVVRNEFVKVSIEQRGHNPSYLSSVSFKARQLSLTTDINQAIEQCQIIILATPSIYLADAMAGIRVDLSDKVFVSAIKGVVPTHNDIVAHYLRDVHQIGFRNQGVIAGPCHAEEVALERLSYLTIAAADPVVCETLSRVLSSRFIKTTHSNDILGIEYAAILKNIYAIGAGMASGLGYGDNFQALYVSNAVREMELFLEQIYQAPRDVNESAYLGDLLVTAYSLFSRNRMLGNLIGKGYTVKSAIQSMSMIAEGYYATRSIYEKAKELKIKTPIISSIYSVLFEEKNVEKQFGKLTEKLT